MLVFWLFAIALADPEQIHVSFGDAPNARVVAWVSLDTNLPGTALSTVWYGTSSSSLNMQASSKPSIWTRDGMNRTLHVVDLKNLVIGSQVFYQVGLMNNGVNYDNVSQSYNFFVNDPSRFPMQFVGFGDFTTQAANPNDGNDSVPIIAQLIRNGSADFVIHVGDVAYNLEDDNSTRGDKFMNSVMPFAAYAPYMLSPGNHELDEAASPVNQATFDNYDHRYAGQTYAGNASLSTHLHYYSWNYGLVHFISYDTDAWIYYLTQKYTHDLMDPQWNWIIQDLASVDRTVTPWIIALPHHSMYCTIASSKNASQQDPQECGFEPQELRDGFNGSYAMEYLLMKFGVDLVLGGHTHHYERTWPIYNQLSTQHDYNNPLAPVHIISGLPVLNGLDYFMTSPPEWCALQELTYTPGINYFTVHNATHLTVEFLRFDTGEVLDNFTIVQTKHGPFLQ